MSVEHSVSDSDPRSFLDALPILQICPVWQHRPDALVSTNDRGQTIENRLQPVQEVAGRLGWVRCRPVT